MLKFQKDQTIPQTGKLDKGTLDRLNTIYDTRKPYIDAAKHDPAKPGTRALSAADKTAAVDAMVAKPGAGGVPAVFTRVTPDGKDYGDEIRDALTDLIKTFHKDLYEDKVGLRADPAKNLHDWSVMEGPPKASKQVTDTLYASNYGVRKAMTIDAPIAAQVEGPYNNGNPPPPDNSGVYPSHAQAEQVVSIVGIKNAQAGYFGGQTKLMGAA